MDETNQRYAVVTGANKGIGFETVRQLASNGVKVVLTARDEKRGLEAVDKLRQLGFSDELVIFHQLDVADDASVAALADFIKSQFGKLDILVNNAGVSGIKIDEDAFKALSESSSGTLLHQEWPKAGTQTYELAEECLEINYYGAKRTAEALLPLLQLSDAPRIVNVSSGAGKLQRVLNEWAIGILSDVENLTVERIDEVVRGFLKDLKEDCLASKNWPTLLPAYTLSKAAMNAYTRILAKRHTDLCINCVSPGYVATDISLNTGVLTVEEGAESLVRLALLPKDGHGLSGHFFVRSEISPF